MLFAVTMDVLDVIILSIILFILLITVFAILVSNFKRPKGKGRKKK